ncbi:MAG: hypothetical protein EBR82_25685 [Caulobacteraceae bacterium]|nr:hypothetical protein [Caulobacteraceae bacterium]
MIPALLAGIGAFLLLVIGVGVLLWRWSDASDPVYVEDDGSWRELSEEEIEYLRTPFAPTDGDRPYIKTSYGQRTSTGSLNGYLARRKLPRSIRSR